MRLAAKIILAGLLLPVAAFADPVATNIDINTRLNNEIALKLGTLEIANVALQAKLDMANERAARLEQMCGDACKPKEPPK